MQGMQLSEAVGSGASPTKAPHTFSLTSWSCHQHLNESTGLLLNCERIDKGARGERTGLLVFVILKEVSVVFV